MPQLVIILLAFSEPGRWGLTAMYPPIRTIIAAVDPVLRQPAWALATAAGPLFANWSTAHTHEFAFCTRWVLCLDLLAARWLDQHPSVHGGAQQSARLYLGQYH